MAWKTPAGQRKPPKQPAKKNGDTSFPGLASPGPEANKKTQYEELQQNEVMVLQAIYGDDFTEHKATHSAWKVCQGTIRRTVGMTG
jgi:translation initiation factor 2-alpha kinase 4